ncbi:hypothetical protein TL16_g10245 [Triparma laevis f. inornata]|uniref:Uncharacterized protein n=2 Tax=Triparma laevis TaxID=1534972 RepID=A0A9W6ZT92_9STRA|nr:hypothetical protein TrLO_g5439 [Triparma laevis f. longispina]GMH85483.1 hypothetical protein TL16_g10245 [Triparma laevis f. inornata]
MAKVNLDTSHVVHFLGLLLSTVLLGYCLQLKFPDLSRLLSYSLACTIVVNVNKVFINKEPLIPELDSDVTKGKADRRSKKKKSERNNTTKKKEE